MLRRRSVSGLGLALTASVLHARHRLPRLRYVRIAMVYLRSKPTPPLVSGSIGALAGSVLVIIFCLMSLGRYEDRVITRLVSASVSPGMGQQDVALALMHVSHDLLAVPTRIAIASGEPDPSGPFLNAVLASLIDGGGCGRHALLLARTLQAAGLGVRIAQMRVRGVFGAHIVVAAEVDGRWIALDPRFDLAFRDETGALASIEDVSRRWDHYRVQVPADYNLNYDYGDISFTNWTRIPVLMPAVRSLIAMALGDRFAESVSLRTGFLNVYRTYAIALVACSVCSVLLMIRIRPRMRSKAGNGADLPMMP